MNEPVAKVIAQIRIEIYRNLLALDAIANDQSHGGSLEEHSELGRARLGMRAAYDALTDIAVPWMRIMNELQSR